MIREVLATKPALLGAREILFRGLLELDQPELARDEIRRALEVEPSSIRWNDLGLLEFQIASAAAATRGEPLRVEDVEPAERALERAIDSDPANPYPCFNLGVVFRETARLDEAIEMHQAALERVDPAHFPCFSTARVWASLGTCYELHGRGYDAIQAYRRAIELEPGDARFHYCLATAYGNAGRYEDMNEALSTGIHSGLDAQSFLELFAQQRVRKEFVAAYVLALEAAGRSSDATDVGRRCALDPAKVLQLAPVMGVEPSEDLLRALEAGRPPGD